MKRIKTALFTFILFSILLSSTPVTAATTIKSTPDPHPKIIEDTLNIDAGMLKTIIPDIDPKMLLPGNTGIDPKILVRP